MTRIVPTEEARDLLQPIPDTEVEPYTEASFFHEADGEVEFHGVRYTDKRTVDGITYPVNGCTTRAWTDLTATAPNLAHTVVQQAEQIKRLQNAVKFLLEDFNDADQDIFSERYMGQGEFEPYTIEDYGLTEKDMNP